MNLCVLAEFISLLKKKKKSSGFCFKFLVKMSFIASNFFLVYLILNTPSRNAHELINPSFLSKVTKQQ